MRTRDGDTVINGLEVATKNGIIHVSGKYICKSIKPRSTLMIHMHVHTIFYCGAAYDLKLSHHNYDLNRVKKITLESRTELETVISKKNPNQTNKKPKKKKKKKKKHLTLERVS